MGMDVYNVTGQILDLATKLSPHAIYGSGAHIACIGVKDELSTHVGAFCLFMQGDNAHGIYEPITGFQATGIEGSLIKSKTLELYQHRCRACGSVPISNNNDPNEQGILTINYVRDNAGCAGRQLCDPTIKAGDKVHNPFNKDRDTTRGTSEVVNSTADGTQPCAQEPRDPVVTDLQGVPIEECNPLFGPSPNATVVNNEIARANVGANHEKNASTNAIAKANSPGLMANLTTLLVSTSMRRVAPTTVSTVVLLSSPAPVSSGFSFPGGH